MSRADDLQAAHASVPSWKRGGSLPPFDDLLTLHAAIPDLLAVVRAAQAMLNGKQPFPSRDAWALDRRWDSLEEALAAFEAGGKERE